MFRLAAHCLFSLGILLLSSFVFWSCGDDNVVGPTTQEVSKVEISSGGGQLVPDEVLRLTASATDTNGKVVSSASIAWASSNSAVATVDQSGTVTAVVAGLATISASVGTVSDDISVSVVELAITEQTFVVDSLELSLLSDSAERVTGTYRFRASGDAASELEVGQVLVGVQEGGYLRRIESLDIQGDEVVTQTSQATLEDVFKSGGFSTRVQFSSGTPAGSFQLHAVPVGDIEVLYLAEGASLNLNNLSTELISLDNVDLCEELLEGTCPEGLELTIPSGGIWFDPEFVVEADYGIFSGLAYARAEAYGSLDAHVDVYAHAEAEFSKSGERLLARLARTFIIHTPAGIPIALQLIVEVYTGFEAHAFAEASVQTGVEGHLEAKFGATWDRSRPSGQEWERTWPNSLVPEFTQRETTWDYGATANVQVYVRPELEMRLYWVFGGTIGLIPYLEADAGVDTENWFLVLYGGIDHEIDLDLSILGTKILGYETGRIEGLREEIFRAEGVFGAGTIYGTVRDVQSLDPISNAMLVLRSQSSGEELVATTSIGGDFVFAQVTAGEYELRVSHSSYEENLAQNLRIVEVAAGDFVQVDFQLAPVGSGLQVANIAGRVVDEAGKPIPGASIQISGGAQTNGVFKSTTTNIDGTYVLGGVVLTDAATGAPIESFTVIASKSGYDPLQIGSVKLTANQTLTNLDFVLLPAGPVTTFFSDGFEGGLSWTVDGFWNQTDGSGIVNLAFPDFVNLAPDDMSEAKLPAAPEGSKYAWYGDPARGNFIGEQAAGDIPGSGGTSTGPNSGTLMSPPIILPSGEPVLSLSFDTWFEIESVNPNAGGFDLMHVGILDEATGSFIDLVRLNPEVDPELEDRAPIPFTSGGFNRVPEFRPVSLSVDSFAGSSIRIVFLFETVDGLYNGFRGWVVDNVRITDQPVVYGNDVVENIVDLREGWPVIGHRCGNKICLDPGSTRGPPRQR